MWFPFLLVALTVILAVTIVLVNKVRSDAAAEYVSVLEIEEVPAEKIDIDAYKTTVGDYAIEFRALLEDADSEVGDVRAVRDSLIDMKVPSEYRDTHIKFVATANQLILGLDGDELALADAQLRFSNLVKELVWME